MIEGHEKTLLAAQGYCELGMFDDALAELNALPAVVKRDPAAIELRLAILMQARRWKSALTVSRELCRACPEKNIGYIHAAFCLHELGNTDEARSLLLTGPATLHTDPTYHYNLACYEARLGDLNAARRCIDAAIELNSAIKKNARTDPDLAALWN